MNLPARPRLVSNTPAPPPGGQTPAVEHGSGAPARSALDKHVLDYLDQGLCIFDSDQRLVLANARFLEIYGLSLRQAQPGMPFVELVAQRFRTGLLAEDLASILAQEGAPPTSHPPDETQILDDGRCIIVRRRPMQHGGWMVTYEDVTERCRAEQRIQHMALHDALTGLPNRLVLRRRLLAALHSAHSGDAVALHCIDLDRFKLVNDTYGHGVGDKLLKIVGERLRASVRTTDTVARLGGDEFAIVQPGVRRQSDAATLAERIIARLSEPMRIDEKIIDIGASIGIAMTQQGEIDEDALMRHADVALYRAKNAGRGACRFFEPSMANELRDKHLLEADLRLAVARRQLVLHYQPLMDLATMRVCGFEALLRWQHPERGLVPPDQFIPIAEETGLIIHIGEWVLQQACADAAGWPEDIRVAVNLSPAQLKGDGIRASLTAALKASGLDPRRLEVEITEGLFLADGPHAMEMLQEVKALGVRISIDDFGTGYSSFNYLSSFPFDKIKIDRSFIRGLPEEKRSLAILRSVVGLAKALGISTTAEGIETVQQLLAARVEGCNEVQGYLLSKPKPLAGTEDIIARYNAPGANGCGLLTPQVA